MSFSPHHYLMEYMSYVIVFTLQMSTLTYSEVKQLAQGFNSIISDLRSRIFHHLLYLLVISSLHWPFLCFKHEKHNFRSLPNTFWIAEFRPFPDSLSLLTKFLKPPLFVSRPHLKNIPNHSITLSSIWNILSLAMLLWRMVFQDTHLLIKPAPCHLRHSLTQPTPFW